MQKKPMVPEDVAFILNKIHSAHFEAYIVGGCVRDTLLGIAPKDWDITTNATPMEVKSLFPHTFDTGIEHGTVTIVKNHENYEVTTYRIDGIYEDGRHPKEVQFTSLLQEDLRRRDFTINAIAYNETEGYRDFFEGQKDLQNKQLRGVGDALLRFQEDALRMLRCVRFSAQLDFDIEKNTYDALQNNVNNIKKISEERIRIELEKLFLSKHVSRMPNLWHSGLLKEIDDTFAERIMKIDGLLQSLEQCQPIPVLRWTLVLQNYTKKEAQKFFKSLKFDNYTDKTVCILLEDLKNPIPATPYAVRKQLGQLGEENFKYKCHLQQILFPTHDFASINAFAQNVLLYHECTTIKELNLNGNELIDLGVPKGKQIGEVQKYLLEEVLQNPQNNTKEKLEELVKKWQC